MKKDANALHNALRACDLGSLRNQIIAVSISMMRANKKTAARSCAGRSISATMFSGPMHGPGVMRRVTPPPAP